MLRRLLHVGMIVGGMFFVAMAFAQIPDQVASGSPQENHDTTRVNPPISEEKHEAKIEEKAEEKLEVKQDIPAETAPQPDNATVTPPSSPTIEVDADGPVEATNQLSETEEKESTDDGAKKAGPTTEDEVKALTQKRSSDYVPPALDQFKASWQGSLMFYPEEILTLQRAMQAVKIGNQGGAEIVDSVAGVLGGVTDAVRKKKELLYPNVSPVFYINSIVYISENDWIVWVNNKRFVSSEKDAIIMVIPNLKITSVEEDKVQLQWATGFLDFVSPQWVSKMRPVRGQAEYKGSEKPIRIVRHLMENNRYSNPKTLESPADIAFVLEPNQTFSVHNMDIVEGDVMPVPLSPPVQEDIVDKVKK